MRELDKNEGLRDVEEGEDPHVTPTAHEDAETPPSMRRGRSGTIREIRGLLVKSTLDVAGSEGDVAAPPRRGSLAASQAQHRAIMAAASRAAGGGGADAGH